ncbi:MAG TPA: hypothetical protein VF789_13140 [Thermoanaerobaculia bacterium]
MQTVRRLTPAVLSVGAILGVIVTFAFFLDRPSEAGIGEGIDTACIARIRQPESSPPEVIVANEDLQRLAGNYMQTEMGLVIKMEALENRLRATVLQGAPFPPSELIPVSPTCFRWEGKDLAPGLTAVFHVDEKAVELTIVQPGKPEVVMKRTPGKQTAG